MSQRSDTELDSDKQLREILGKLEASVLHFEAMGEIKGGQDGYDGYMPRVRAEAKQRLNALIEKKGMDKVTKALTHAEKLRHAIRVDHWQSSCENCRENIVGTPKNCPRCKYRFDYFTTMYPNEKDTAQAVFPDLPYLSYYDYGLIELQDNQPSYKKEGHDPYGHESPVSCPAGCGLILKRPTEHLKKKHGWTWKDGALRP